MRQLISVPLTIVVIFLAGVLAAPGLAQPPEYEPPEDPATPPPVESEEDPAADLEEPPEEVAPGDPSLPPDVPPDIPPPPPPPGQVDTQPRYVEFDIMRSGETWGTLVIELYPEKAPRTVFNFLRYVEEGFYNDTIIHRVIPNFIVQAGGYKRGFREKRAGLHSPVESEWPTGLRNEPLTVAMARLPSDPDSATSQFFINLNDNDYLDNPEHGGKGFVVFGRVVDGEDVIVRIREVRTRRSSLASDADPSQPILPPMIKSARVRTEPFTKKASSASDEPAIKEPTQRKAAPRRSVPRRPSRGPRFKSTPEKGGSIKELERPNRPAPKRPAPKRPWQEKKNQPENEPEKKEN